VKFTGKKTLKNRFILSALILYLNRPFAFLKLVWFVVCSSQTFISQSDLFLLKNVGNLDFLDTLTVQMSEFFCKKPEIDTGPKEIV